MSLQKKVFLFAGIGLLIPFGLLVLLGVRAVEESTQRTFDERVVTAQMVAEGVDQTLQKALGDLQQFATMTAVNLGDGDPVPEATALNDLYRFSRVFNSVFVVDSQGKAIYALPARDAGTDLTIYTNVKKTLSDWEVHISSTSQPDASASPVFTLSVPILSRENVLDGVIGGTIDLSRGEIGSIIQPIRLGQTAFAEVVSEEGLVMAATKINPSGVFEETEYAKHFASLISGGEPAQETCYRCHETANGVERQEDVLVFAPLKTVTGGVAIRQSKEEAFAPIRRLERDMLAAGSSVFVIGLFLTWMGTKGLVRPVSKLTVASRRITAGDLDTPIEEDRKDELGTLARTLEQMRVRLKESLEEKEERTKESESRAQALSALNTIAATVSRSLELEQVLDDSLDKVLQTVRLEAGGIFLRNEATGELSLKARRGEFGSDSPPVTLPPGYAAKDAPFATDVLHPDNGGSKFRTVVNVPLTSKGRMLGMMVLATPEKRQFSSQEIALLTAIGHQMGTGIDNAQLFRHAQMRESEARALYRIGVEISSLLDLSKILNSVADNALRLLGADVSTLALLDENTQEVYMAATSGTPGQHLRHIRVKLGQGIIGRVVSMGQPFASEDYLNDPAFAHTVEVDSVIRNAGLRAHLAVPLKIGERVFGCLSVGLKERHTFTEHEGDLLNQLAHQAAVATENARLYSQVQDMAILEERDRIAREMHDGLGQVLGYLIIKARTTEDFITSDQKDSAVKEITEIKKVAREAYEEVREGILGLRSKVSPKGELLPILEKYLAAFRVQAGIPVAVEVRDERATRMSSRIAVQLVRVIQEALANVRKHARATGARVRFEAEGNLARITIEDDGVGFDPSRFEQPDHLHFGLQTMRERAESVEGAFELVSAPGKGTWVTIRVPIDTEESNNHGTA